MNNSNTEMSKTTVYPVPSAPRSTVSSPPPSYTASSQPLVDAVAGSTVHQLGRMKIEELASKDQGIRRKLWKCEFCDQPITVKTHLTKSFIPVDTRRKFETANLILKTH